MIWCSSSPSTPVSAIMLKIVAKRLVEAEIILVTCFVVGIIGDSVPFVSWFFPLNSLCFAVPFVC